MNKRQLIVMWIGIAVMVLMSLFPPFIDTDSKKDGYNEFRGYHFFTTSHFFEPIKQLSSNQGGQLFFPLLTTASFRDYLNPKPTGTYYQVEIDFQRLYLQWFLVALITSGAILSLRDKPLTIKVPSDEESQVQD